MRRRLCALVGLGSPCVRTPPRPFPAAKRRFNGLWPWYPSMARGFARASADRGVSHAELVKFLHEIFGLGYEIEGGLRGYVLMSAIGMSFTRRCTRALLPIGPWPRTGERTLRPMFLSSSMQAPKAPCGQTRRPGRGATRGRPRRVLASSASPSAPNRLLRRRRVLPGAVWQRGHSSSGPAGCGRVRAVPGLGTGCQRSGSLVVGARAVRRRQWTVPRLPGLARRLQPRPTARFGSHDPRRPDAR
jgi:hypothetical protein